jgi:nicotinamidase-related amidase
MCQKNASRLHEPVFPEFATISHHMDTPRIDPNNTVVLCMDYQNDIVNNYTSDPQLLTRASSVLERARSKGMPIVYVAVRFRPGHPEIPDHGMFKMAKAANRLVETTEGAQIHDAVAPRPGDIVMAKRRVSAFTGSDLDCVLRGLGRQHLVLFGIATSGVVLSTVRQAADLDYQMNVITDCCADRDAEVHRVLTEKVFAMMAPGITCEQFLAATS